MTDDRLRELFAKHCQCRPLDLARKTADHAAAHDCDTDILHDIQIARGRKIDAAAEADPSRLLAAPEPKKRK